MLNKVGIIALLFVAVFATSFSSVDSGNTPQKPASQRELKVQKQVLSEMLSFRNYLRDTLFFEVNKAQPDEQKLKQAFLQSRLLYKKFEWAAAYFSADLNKRLNGPPVNEVENADLLDASFIRSVDPMGLQVVEGFIYPGYDVARKNELISEIKHLITNTEYVMSYFSALSLADWRILDAAKLEVFRIITLGITGYDNALSLKSMEESSMSLKSLRPILSLYLKGKNSTLLTDLDGSVSYLDTHADFDSFDRAVFIKQFGNKISAGITELEQALPGPKIKYNRMLNQEAATLFDVDAFNVNAFAPGPEFQATPAKVALGEKLFYDVSLSGTLKRSCASCHQPDLAFTDGLARNTDIHNASKLLSRNVPTLLNAALQSNYFYDNRSLTLEDQALEVIKSKQEMDGSMEAILKYLSANKSYQLLFSKAFFIKDKQAIDAGQVTNALASYVRSLTQINSRFDDYMRGTENALSAQEVNGFNLFMGKAKCATCHFMPLFNGVTPPKYVQSEVEVLGVPVSLTDPTLDADLGYYNVVGVDSYKNGFKIPTIRNIKKTAPYMHNGIYQTLGQVMDFYDNGGGAGLGMKLPNQTLSGEPLHLTVKEKAAIIAFMESLESKPITQSKGAASILPER